MLDHRTRKLLGWSFGDRSVATGKQALEKVGYDRVSILFADAFSAYPDIAGTLPLVQSKKYTYQSEQNNACQRHWLASFHRRSQVVTRSVVMLEARMRLFARFRSNGNIFELTSLFRKSISMLK